MPPSCFSSNPEVKSQCADLIVDLSACTNILRGSLDPLAAKALEVSDGTKHLEGSTRMCELKNQFAFDVFGKVILANCVTLLQVSAKDWVVDVRADPAL